jgi:hypothetical protein
LQKNSFASSSQGLYFEVCFTGNIVIIEVFHPWRAQSPWLDAIKVGLTGVTAGALVLALRKPPAKESNSA